MKFSVIIPVRKITDNLKETVSHLKKVKYYDFEVIIVADEQVTANFGFKEGRFRIVNSSSASPGEKRNIGAREARGEILAFLDDDAFPEVNWIRSAANIFDEFPELYALGGPALTPADVPLKENIAGKLLESYLVSGSTVYRHKVRPRREIDDFPSVNLFVKKSAFLDVGGFDDNYWPGEDTKLSLDLVNKFGRKFLYDPSPIVYHHRRELFDPYFKQISRYGSYRGWFARVFPKTSRRFSYFVPSLFISGVFLGLLTSLLFMKLMPYYLLSLFLYLTLVFAESQTVSMDDKDFSAFKYMFIGIIKTHFIYGINFIKGFFIKPKLELRSVDSSTGNYQGG